MCYDPSSSRIVLNKRRGGLWKMWSSSDRDSRIYETVMYSGNYYEEPLRKDDINDKVPPTSIHREARPDSSNRYRSPSPHLPSNTLRRRSFSPRGNTKTSYLWRWGRW
ncbi:uncharacterized protein LOC144173222 [Haemaphysalis longicornis]